MFINEVRLITGLPTPWKINIEPTNHPISKGNWSSKPTWLCSMLIFRGAPIFHHFPPWLLQGQVSSWARAAPRAGAAPQGRGGAVGWAQCGASGGLGRVEFQQLAAMGNPPLWWYWPGFSWDFQLSRGYHLSPILGGSSTIIWKQWKTMTWIIKIFYLEDHPRMK